jgi:hypothetical protein
MSAAEWPLPRRWSEGLVLTNIRPAFEAPPEKPKPMTEKEPFISEFEAEDGLRAVSQAVVYASDDPGGACTITNR